MMDKVEEDLSRIILDPDPDEETPTIGVEKSRWIQIPLPWLHYNHRCGWNYRLFSQLWTYARSTSDHYARSTSDQ